MTIKGLTYSSWNMLENINRPRKRDFLHLKPKDGILWSHLAPLWGEIDICAYWLFCTNFNGQQLLFEAFLNIMHIFGRIQLQSEATSSFLNITIFQKMRIFGAPSSTLGGDIHMCPLTFLYRIQKESINYIYILPQNYVQ